MASPKEQEDSLKPNFVRIEGLFQRLKGSSKEDVLAATARVLDYLADEDIRPRSDDGDLRRITLSCAQTEDAIVIGLRYVKKSGVLTEDRFVVRKDDSIVRHYGNDLDQILPEYAGTHKLQAVQMSEILQSTNTVSWPVDPGSASGSIQPTRIRHE